MSVLTNVERKGWKGRLFLIMVTSFLVLGSFTMFYPFSIMVSGSIRSEMDQTESGLIPEYLVDDTMLARKFLEQKYNFEITTANLYRQKADLSFLKATVPDQPIEQRVEDLRQFDQEVDLPYHWQILGATMVYRRVTTPNKHRLTELVRERYDGDLDAVSVDLGSPIPSWRALMAAPPNWTNSRYSFTPSPFYDAYFDLMDARPLAERAYPSITRLFLENMVFPTYGKQSTGSTEAIERFEQFKKDFKLDIDSYQDFALPRRVPSEDNPRFRQAWLDFVQEILNMSFLRSDASHRDYQTFLADIYDNDISKLNQAWELGTKQAFASFQDINLPGEKQWIPAGKRRDYFRFIETLEPASLYLIGPEFAWHDWLIDKYGSLEAISQAHEASYASIGAIPVPIDHVELAHVLAHTSSFRWSFAMGNFRDVLNEVLLQGRPFMNTVIFVTLAVTLALLLMPMAAYGLSRFDPPGTWRLILILMATMAFPPMVGMIPQFLILRSFNLLNTFIALLLPVLVNGYLIFLLKGFFDSLPKHLYEAALIDGASEIRMFFSITMALSKPILAVVALNTFNGTWIMFMYPLLVAPDPDMHVLAVWLYQFQENAIQPAVFASILITSIPTLVVFLITQRTIMRGIAVPAEK